MTLTINNQKIHLNTFEPQSGKNKRPFRLSSTERDENDYYTFNHYFRYVDNSSEGFIIVEKNGIFKNKINIQ